MEEEIDFLRSATDMKDDCDELSDAEEAIGSDKSAARVISPKDLANLYKIFLGREWEPSNPADDRVGAPVPEVVRGFLCSKEFEETTLGPMLAGQSVSGAVFDRSPAQSLRTWAVEHLPLTPKGISRVREATNWYSFHKALYSDEQFVATCLPDHLSAAALAEAPSPPVAALASVEESGPSSRILLSTESKDVANLYRLLLGREWERPDRNDSRVGADLVSVTKAFLRSEEFQRRTLDPMLAGRPVTGSIFDFAPREELKTWVASRLPLTPGGVVQTRSAASWYSLHQALFSDGRFSRLCLPEELIGALADASPPPATELEIATASMLFERDWYLATYPDVAASDGDPLAHYLAYGVSEARNPNRLFDTRWYLASHRSARSSALNPLMHYILIGAQQGLLPHPFFRELDARCRGPATAHGLTPLAYYLNFVHPSDPDSLPKFGPYDVYGAAMRNLVALDGVGRTRHMAVMLRQPWFVVYINHGQQEAGSASAINPLAHQEYKKFSVIWNRGELKSVLSEKVDSHLLWLEKDEHLVPHALYEYASKLNEQPGADVIYADEERLDPIGRTYPFHKPSWSPDFLESYDYLGVTACIRGDLALSALEDADTRYDLILRATEKAQLVCNIPSVLARSPRREDGRGGKTDAIAAIKGRLERTGRRGKAVRIGASGSCYRAEPVLRATPLVSIVIPTAAKIIDLDGERRDLISDCLEGLTERTSYKNIEVVVVDNGDLDHGRLKVASELRLKTLTWDSPEINIAKKINLGTTVCTGEMLLIMNDDIVPITRNWLERMLWQFEKAHVGLVGPKLLYPDGTIQHAGIVMCDGVPEHVRRGFPSQDPGYFHSTEANFNYGAVTGAVSLVRMNVFRRLGGYDEEYPIDFNDVDFAFRVRELGLTVVYEAGTEMIHYESASIVKPPRPEDHSRFLKRWPQPDDPYYRVDCFDKHPPRFQLAYSGRSY